jgi:FG-GAP-like repeat
MPRCAKFVAPGPFSVYVSLSCCLLASTLTLAQSSPVALANQNLAERPSIAAQAAAKGRSAKGKFTRARAQATETPQMLGLNFANAVGYGTGGFPMSVAVTDVNGDGKLDIVVANCGPSNSTCDGTAGTVVVLLGNGNGTFQNDVSYSSGGYDTTAVAVADVNGDGKPDLIVANSCADSTCSTDGSVGVLLGNGDGTFKTAVTYDSGGMKTDSVAVADLGNGKLDVLALKTFVPIAPPAVTPPVMAQWRCCWATAMELFKLLWPMTQARRDRRRLLLGM